MVRANIGLLMTAVLLLFVALIFSRLFGFSTQEGFQATTADICGVLSKGKTDVSSQLDQANSLVNDANKQLEKIKSSLDDITKMSSSVSC